MLKNNFQLMTIFDQNLYLSLFHFSDNPNVNCLPDPSTHSVQSLLWIVNDLCGLHKYAGFIFDRKLKQLFTCKPNPIIV